MPPAALHCLPMDCFECKYDLKGLGPNGVCPECGLAIAESLKQRADKTLPLIRRRSVIFGTFTGLVASIGYLPIGLVLWFLGVPMSVLSVLFALLMPYTQLVHEAFPALINSDWSGLLMLTFLLQCCTYGMVAFGVQWRRPAHRKLVWRVLGLHTLAAITCFGLMLRH